MPPVVLDTDSVAGDDVLVDSSAVVVFPSSPQANSVKPTSVEIAIGADAWTERSAAEQNGQRLSLSHT
jgi:hypothetical protein